MEKIIDLHTHTTASDGSMSPGELVRHAKYSGLSAAAATDHDTVDGIEEALVEGKRIDFEVVPGLEIGVDYVTEMHILGYFFGGTFLRMKDTLLKLRRNREERNPKIIKKLNEMGFDITMEEVEAEAGGNVTGRPHIAAALMGKGYVESIDEAFDKYLSEGRPAYFKKDKLTPEQGIGMISKTGGIPVLAHPLYLNLGFDQLDILLSRLVSAGLAGIEAYYVDNSDDCTEALAGLAGKHKLLVTGGSDFHGSFKPDIHIGKGRGNLKIPYQLLEKMKDYSRIRK